jgi:hypothetical protein
MAAPESRRKAARGGTALLSERESRGSATAADRARKEASLR